MKTEKRSLEETLVLGSNNSLTTDPNQKNKPLVVRGVIKKHHVDQCIKDSRDFYYIDTGYFGNFPSSGNPGGKKLYHRIVKNENQHTAIRDVPDDRYNSLLKQDPRLEFKGWKKYNKKILLVMPNPKACKYYDVNYNEWVEQTKTDIARYIDLPVEVRYKGTRSGRNHENSIYDALDEGVFATVAFNSIAALESIMYGVPAFISVPCCASPIANTDLSKLSDPFMPSKTDIVATATSLAYGQYTIPEIESGFAWKTMEQYEAVN